MLLSHQIWGWGPQKCPLSPAGGRAVPPPRFGTAPRLRFCRCRLAFLICKPKRLRRATPVLSPPLSLCHLSHTGRKQRLGLVAPPSPIHEEGAPHEGAAVAPVRQVSGVLGESALLTLDLPHNGTMKEIEWTFLTGEIIVLAEFNSAGFERPDPKDRFGDRLEVNETMLRIRDLKWGDNGTYHARIKLMGSPALVETRTFDLSLYEPLPEPEIQIQQESLTAQECNLTLRCQVPAGSAARVTWQPQGHLFGESQTLCLSLSLPVTPLHSSYTCVATNPVQERNVTVQLGSLCENQGHSGRIWDRLLIGLVLVALGMGAAGAIWLWRKKRRRRRKKAAGGGNGSARDGPDGAALAPCPSQDPPPEVLYSEIQRVTPLESQERLQDNLTTVYSLVQA